MQKKNGDKDRKALYRLMTNAAYGKAMEDLRDRTDIKVVSNEKDYMKWTSKSSYMSQKILDNDLFAIRKSKVTLTINKPGYGGMYILDLCKILMYEFHCDYIKNKDGTRDYYLLTLIV